MTASIIDTARARYTSKAYDSSGKLTSEQEAQIKELLQLAPSSINSQPWHFILASTEQGKARIAKAAQGSFQYSANSIHNASHVIVFASRTEMSDDYIHHFINQEDQDGRFLTPENKAQRLKVSTFFADVHREKLKDAEDWMEKQVYLNLGFFLLGVAALGVDATPMEGIDTQILDGEFGLPDKGFKSLFIVCLGARDPENDFNAKLPKSRLPESEIITTI